MLSPARLPGYRWSLLVAVMLFSTPLYWYALSIGLLLPDMRSDLGLTPAREGILSASFFLGGLMFTVPLTGFYSRYRPAPLMGVIFGLCAGTLALAAAIASYPAQLAARFLLAALLVAQNPARTLIIHEWFRPAEYALANGVAVAMFGVIDPVAFWLTAPVLDLLGGWRAMFVFFAVLAGGATAGWLLFARDRAVGAEPEPRSGAAPGHASIRRLLGHREVWYMALAAFGGNMTWAAFITFWPTVARDSFALPENTVGLLMAITPLVNIPVSLALAPYLALRTGRRAPLIVAPSLAQVPIFVLMASSGNLGLLVLAAVAQGISWGYFPILMTAPFQLHGVSAREIAVAGAFISVSSMGSAAAGAALAGALGEAMPLRTALIGMSFWPLVSALGGLLLGEPAREPQSAPSAVLPTTGAP